MKLLHPTSEPGFDSMMVFRSLYSMPGIDEMLSGTGFIYGRKKEEKWTRK